MSLDWSMCKCVLHSLLVYWSLLDYVKASIMRNKSGFSGLILYSICDMTFGETLRQTQLMEIDDFELWWSAWKCCYQVREVSESEFTSRGACSIRLSTETILSVYRLVQTVLHSAVLGIYLLQMAENHML